MVLRYRLVLVQKSHGRMKMQYQLRDPDADREKFSRSLGRAPGEIAR